MKMNFKKEIMMKNGGDNKDEGNHGLRGDEDGEDEDEFECGCEMTIIQFAGPGETKI